MDAFGWISLWIAVNLCSMLLLPVSVVTIIVACAGGIKLKSREATVYTEGNMWLAKQLKKTRTLSIVWVVLDGIAFFFHLGGLLVPWLILLGLPVGIELLLGYKLSTAINDFLVSGSTVFCVTSNLFALTCLAVTIVGLVLNVLLLVKTIKMSRL